MSLFGFRRHIFSNAGSGTVLCSQFSISLPARECHRKRGSGSLAGGRNRHLSRNFYLTFSKLAAMPTHLTSPRCVTDQRERSRGKSVPETKLVRTHSFRPCFIDKKQLLWVSSYNCARFGAKKLKLVKNVVQNIC